MMKLLYKPTGIIFTLPDEDALKHKNSDRGNFEIIDAGITEEQEPEQITQEEVDKIEEALEGMEEEDKPEEVIEETKKVEYEKMANKELRAICKKLGIANSDNMNKAQLVKAITEFKGE